MVSFLIFKLRTFRLNSWSFCAHTRSPKSRLYCCFHWDWWWTETTQGRSISERTHNNNLLQLLLYSFRVNRKKEEERKIILTELSKANKPEEVSAWTQGLELIWGFSDFRWGLNLAWCWGLYLAASKIIWQLWVMKALSLSSLWFYSHSATIWCPCYAITISFILGLNWLVWFLVSWWPHWNCHVG